MDSFEENIKFNKVLTVLCSELDKLIASNEFESNANRQKISAISSFLEFIKDGADISVLPIDYNKATYIVEMK